MNKVYGYDNNIYETSIGNIKKDKEINIVMAPRGYGKCYKEYKEVIKYFENKIEQLEKDNILIKSANKLISEKLEQIETNRDKAIEICDFYNKNMKKIH